MPLWNRSSSLASSGGITNRSGGNTQEIYKTESSTPSTPQNSPSSEKSWFGKAWDTTKNFVSNHAKGIGHAVNAALTGGAAIADKALFGGVPVASTAVNIGKSIVSNVAGGDKDSGFGKFAKGLSDKGTESGVNKLVKGYDIYKNDKLNKAAKVNEFKNLMKNNKSFTSNDTSNTSNGHVPIGYPAASSQGATVPSASTPKSIISTGSTSSPNLQKQSQKNNKKNNAKKKQKVNPLMAWRKKQMNRNKRRNKK